MITLNLEALRELEKLIVSGDFKRSAVLSFVEYNPNTEGWSTSTALAAHNSSLDAAQKLHEAVLGERWTRSVDATVPEAGIAVSLHRNGAGEIEADLPNEARAWLLAIIRALIAEEESK